ncbi:hypothetical protein ABH15_06535 [Methanoculleus taiwanensis]|uniref:Uncharacterized protein n=1 Tax=Methanoculleus taiwanensis TaxID=1550565 RepID=A0A498H1G9_9EURY|nr:hypothetical protein [Methanoculleus taiwanensis]RXE55870.1 hypothetical protein ABH15_06535 [Methanoculleus taiwanensis]
MHIPDLTTSGALLTSLSIIAGGIIIGAMIFQVPVPLAPYIMVALAVLVVIGAAALLAGCRGAGESTAGK